jgi:hypothetical protein
MNFYKFIIISLLLSLQHCSTNKTSLISMPTFGIPLELSEEVYKKLENYNRGNVYSYDLKNMDNNVAPVYFILSKTGGATSIGYCRDFDPDNCNDGVLLSQLIQRCEKQNKEICKLLVHKDEIILNNQKIKLEEAISKKNIFFKINMSKQNSTNHSSIMVDTITNNSEQWD